MITFLSLDRSDNDHFIFHFAQMLSHTPKFGEKSATVMLFWL